MKNAYSYLILLTVFTILTAGSCKKEKPCTDPICQLPPITQEGKNIFGCLVDGKPWTANTSDAFLTAPSFDPIYVMFPIRNGIKFFNLNLNRRNRKEGIDSDISISIENAIGVGIYLLNNNDAIGYPVRSAYKSIGLFSISDSFAYPYETDSLHTGQVTITKYDTVNKIYSGTFYFTAQNINNDSIVHITDGRFDIKLP
jgi:hypothetical protein